MTAVRTALLALALVVGGSASAQPADPDALVRAVREATEQLDYAAAEARARAVLARYEAFSPDQLVEVHTTLGIVLHARNDDVEARRQFESALSIDPAHTLDPVLVSPKTVELFEAVRAGLVRAVPAPGAAGTPALRYVVLPDPRAGAALRSAVLPGWGQFHKGDRARGWAFAVGVGVAAAGTAAVHVAYGQARGRYDDATTPDEIDRTYRQANRLYRARGALALGTALGWAASVVEALATGGPRAPGPGRRVALAAPGTGLGLRVEF
ncbi:MAG TPA: hypothetical protein VF576_11690 [Rubricoccaceae bacterium]|jgi:hypothetical protein